MAKIIITTPPWCPFCGQKVGRPSDAPARKMHEFPVGNCQCGAVYTCDATGHNVGAAIVETLVYACDGNADFAWDLVPEDDYLTGRIENYDEQTHQVVAKKNLGGRGVRGVLYFIRLHTDVPTIVKKTTQKTDGISTDSMPSKPERKRPPVEPAAGRDRVRKRATKAEVKDLVDTGDIDGLVGLCFDNKKTLRLMQRLLYDPMESNRWYVAWIIGQVCARVSTREPGQVAELLHRLFEACSDSAATPWGMIETIGYVVSMQPDIFGAFTRHLLNYLGDSSTRSQVLWALAEIAENRPDLIRNMPFYTLFDFLQDPDSQVRGNAVRLLGRIKATEVAIQVMGLSGDMEEYFLYTEGKLVTSTVAAEASAAIQAIKG
jgi:hypothetical protein